MTYVADGQGDQHLASSSGQCVETYCNCFFICACKGVYTLALSVRNFPGRNISVLLYDRKVDDTDRSSPIGHCIVCS